MIERHQQLFRHDPENGIYGDCFRTSIACMLRMKPEDVPHVYDGPEDETSDGLDKMKAWLWDRGVVIVSTAFDSNVDFATLMEIGRIRSGPLHWLLSGQSRNGVNHVVVCKGDEIIHDPSIDQSGIVGPSSDGLWWIEWLVRPAPCDEVPS